jgi:hypothetical protein
VSFLRGEMGNRYKASEWQFESRLLGITATPVSKMTPAQLKQALCLMIEAQEEVVTKIYEAQSLLHPDVT